MIKVQFIQLMGKCAESPYLKELIGYYGNMDTYTLSGH